MKLILAILLLVPWLAQATPANKAALVKYYAQYLPTNLNSCTTCHLPAKLDHPPENLDEFPHNDFGKRLRALGKELIAQGKSKDLPTRLQMLAREDSDGDGIANESELLLGHGPGDAKDKPTKKEQRSLAQREALFAKFVKSYRWEPFQSIREPPVPTAITADSRAPEWRGKAAGTFSAAKRPATSGNAAEWARNPIDAFIAAEHQARNVAHRPEASKDILLRRVYLDLIGLTPTPQEQREFAADSSADAYEKVVDRLLNDARYGERWGRHWMDVWRYSDWAGWSGGNQIRDSKPHIWRWRDWIVESLNNDKGYDRMLLEMLAADELAPEDTNALRATGFLVRNYKMLSREQWMEDCVKHTSQAFLGVTVGCARCHNHMYDPISQKDYYNLRAIFEPHQVRTDRLPGQLDITRDGLVRVFDTNTNAPTYFFPRGDERRPDTNQIMQPGVPAALCGATALVRTSGKLDPRPVSLPRFAAHPDKREFVIRDALRAAQAEVDSARQTYDAHTSAVALTGRAAIVPNSLNPEILKGLRQIFGDATNSAANDARQLASAKSTLAVAEARLAALRAVLRAEALEDAGQKNSGEWKEAARAALEAQRNQAKAEAEQKLLVALSAEADAQSKLDAANKSSTDEKKTKEAVARAAKVLETTKKMIADAEKALAEADAALQKELTTAYKPRSTDDFPDASTGRRLAFARWLIDRQNPLTARVAVNHIWARHFGQGIVPTPNDFGANGRPPSHPALLDWLASQFMAQGWSMKQLHRLIVTSSTYRMVSTRDHVNARIDPDNIYLWRMPSRRMEAEVVRDNLLYLSGNLDATMGGPDIDHRLGLVSKRRSIYLRTAAEKEVEFLKIFDNASVTECYFRKPSVMPQQALALANSELALNQAQLLSDKLLALVQRNSDEFINLAFAQILARAPKPEELHLCRDFLLNNKLPLTNYQLPINPPPTSDSRIQLMNRPAGLPLPRGEGRGEGEGSVLKYRGLESKARFMRSGKEPSSVALIPISTKSLSGPGPLDPRRARALILVLFNHNDFVSIR